MNKYKNAIKLMNKRFKKDSLISVATLNEGKPAVRMVDAYYVESEHSFYTITYALSNKMKQIAVNPDVAISAVDWFTGVGVGENLGWVGDEKHIEIMATLRKAFAKWYALHQDDEKDPNTCILRIKLKSGLLIDNTRTFGFREYDLNFQTETVRLLSTSSHSAVINTEGRSDVLEVINPQSWAVAHYDLSMYKDKKITIKFSADVKRLGASADLQWQVNNDDYPIVGNKIENAETDKWHSIGGEWTGIPTNNYPSLFMSTHENNSESTTYLISNFNIEVTRVKGA